MSNVSEPKKDQAIVFDDLLEWENVTSDVTELCIHDRKLLFPLDLH